MLSAEALLSFVLASEGQIFFDLEYTMETLGLNMRRIEDIFKTTVLQYGRRRPIEVTADYYSGPDIKMPQNTLGIKSIRWGILPEYPRFFQQAWDEVTYEWIWNGQTKMLKVFPPNTQIKVTSIVYPTLTKSQQIIETFAIPPGVSTYEDVLQNTYVQGTLGINEGAYTMAEIARDSYSFTGNVSDVTFTGNITPRTFTGDISSTVFTGTVTNNSNTITSIQDTTALSVGLPISGQGVPTGTFISSIDSTTQISMSNVIVLDQVNVGVTYNSIQNTVGTVINGSNIITNIPNTSNMSVGMDISGTGIPLGSTITSIDSVNQIEISSNVNIDQVNINISNNSVVQVVFTVPSNIITNIPSTINMSVGMPVSGNGIPANTIITSIDSATQIHISNSISASQSVALTSNATVFTGTVVDGSNVITNISDISGLSVMSSVTGYGIPNGTIISSIDSATQIHISNSVLIEETGVVFTIPSNIITNIANTSSLVVGAPVVANGIPANTTITSIDSLTQIEISNNVSVNLAGITFTVPNNIIFNITDTSGLVVGMPITGTNIPAGTTITSIDSATQIEVSNDIDVSGVGITFTVPVPGKILLSGTLGTGIIDIETREFTLDLSPAVVAVNATVGGEINFSYYPKYYCCLELDQGDFIFVKFFTLNVLRSLANLKAQMSQKTLHNIDLTSEDLMGRVRELDREVRDLLRKSISISGTAQI